jgi:hypothetical protein
MNKSCLTFLVLILINSSLKCIDTPVWGHLANPGFENDPVKSTVFFSGNWRNEVQFYDYNPTSNIGLYSMFPTDSRHLGWSENVSFRNFALNTMIDAGVNVVCMSYWGLPGSDNWASWAPMQCATGSHDELFNAALNKDILIAPFIESFAATDDYPGFSFMDDFGGSEPNVSPEFLVLVEDLVERYLINPSNSNWSDQWARVYDQDGNERYMISIIHVASNEPGMTDEHFANCFDVVADQVFESKGVHVGFALDILPPDTYAPGIFKATPVNTGPYLASQSSVLAIQCFIPEIWLGSSDETELIDWKRDYMVEWINTGIPVYHDISSGYDAHIIFPTSPVYGNNFTWRNYQTQLIEEFESEAFTVSAWNGYTEGFVAVPTAEYGDSTYNWICTILGGTCGVDPEPSLINKNSESSVLDAYFDGENIKIKFALTKKADMTIRVYNSTGNQIITHHFKNKPAGEQEIELHTGELPIGIYYVSLENGRNKILQKLALLTL